MSKGPQFYQGQRVRNKQTGDHVSIAAVVPLNGGKEIAYRLTDTGNKSLTERQVQQQYDVLEPATA